MSLLSLYRRGRTIFLTCSGAFLQNEATCAFVGVLLYFLIGSMYYNCFLAFYYWLKVKHRLTEQQVAQKYEIWLHGVAWLIPLVLDVTGIVTGSFNPHPFVRTCDFYPFPTECMDPDSGVPCTRGLYTPTLGLASFSLLGLAALLGIYLTIRVYWHVRSTLAKGNKWNITAQASRQRMRLQSTKTGNKGDPRSELGAVTTTRTITRRANDGGREKSASDRLYRSMAVQAALYCLAYVNVGVWLC
jgi:hypothetical protein